MKGVAGEGTCDVLYPFVSILCLRFGAGMGMGRLV